MKWVFGLAIALGFFAYNSATFAQQCNRQSGSQSSMNNQALTSLPYSNSYSNYSNGASYVPTASQALAYNTASMQRAMASQRMDRLAQMEMVNQIAAQRAAIRNAQKAKKEAKKAELYTGR
jgi:hypothetical protein